MKVKDLITLLQAQDPESEVDVSIKMPVGFKDYICDSVGANIVGGFVSQDAKTNERVLTLSNDPDFIEKMNS